MKLLIASTLACMDRLPIRDGAVLIDGATIRAVGEALSLRRQHPAADVVDLGGAVLTPGLVNAHTHLELSDVTRPEEPGRFTDWLMALIRGRMALGERVSAAAGEAALQGAAESLKFGVTCVGDITRFAAATRAALADSPLRVVSFGEIQAMAGRRHLLESRLAEATDLARDDWTGPARLLVGISPHAPYSVEPPAFSACLDWASRHGRPLTTHLAETPAEAAFLAEHSGPFRELWGALGDWSEDVPRHAGGPVRLAEQLGLLAHPTLLAHVNYVDNQELALLARGKAAVVWCPRTHAYFGHEPHRFREMAARGVLVCLGTDSRASAPDLNVLEEARALSRLHPDLAAQDLWQMITSRAAAALGVGRWVGSIKPGAWADLAVWPQLDAGSPLAAILDSNCLPQSVWIGGERLVPQGP